MPPLPLDCKARMRAGGGVILFQLIGWGAAAALLFQLWGRPAAALVPRSAVPTALAAGLLAGWLRPPRPQDEAAGRAALWGWGLVLLGGAVLPWLPGVANLGGLIAAVQATAHPLLLGPLLLLSLARVPLRGPGRLPPALRRWAALAPGAGLLWVGARLFGGPLSGAVLRLALLPWLAAAVGWWAEHAPATHDTRRGRLASATGLLLLAALDLVAAWWLAAAAALR